MMSFGRLAPAFCLLSCAGPAPDNAHDPKPQFTEAERELLRTLSPKELPAPPADATNRFADDGAAASFGQRLFFDTGLSGRLLDGDNDGSPAALGMEGVDRSTRFDVYISTKRSYLFADNKPYGCVDMPEQGVPEAGAVTITFGDVLYHSGVDPVFSYYESNLKVASARHYDNLGFKSGVEGPTWDEQNLPCFPSSTFGRPR